MGWRKFVLKSLPELNASNALRRRLFDEAEDDDDADEDDKGEKLGCVSDWDCCWWCCWCCWMLDTGCEEKSGNFAWRSEANDGCWSTRSLIQLEQTLEDEEDVMTIGISFKHDEHTPPVMLLLFILLVSFILLFIRSLFSASRAREREARRANRPRILRENYRIMLKTHTWTLLPATAFSSLELSAIGEIQQQSTKDECHQGQQDLTKAGKKAKQQPYSTSFCASSVPSRCVCSNVCR